MPNLDQLLHIISIVAWVIVALLAIVTFVTSLLREGLITALLRMLSSRILIPVALAICVSLLSAAIVFVYPTQVGVVISLLSPSGVRPQPLRAGLHLILPVLENEVIYPISWQTYTMSAKLNEGQKPGDDSIRARTSDGQEVRLDSSVIFRVNQDRVVILHAEWQMRYVDDFVRPVVRGVVRTQVSQFTVKEVNSSARADLEATLERLLRAEFDAKGLIVDQFLLRDITFTDQYANAIEEKQVALEGEQRTKHQAEQMRNLAAGERDKTRLQAEGRRDQLKIEAEGRAAAILVEAQAQADGLKLIAAALQNNPDLLTYEYIQKLSPNIRAMLVPNNAPLILPLPDLDQSDTATPTMPLTAPITAPIMAAITPVLTNTLATTSTLTQPTATPVADRRR